MTTDNQQAPMAGEVAEISRKLYEVSTRCDHHYSLDRTAATMLESLSAQVEALKRERDEYKQLAADRSATVERYGNEIEAAEQRADRLQAQVCEGQGEITNLQSHLLALGADSYLALYGFPIIDGKDELSCSFTIEHAVAAIREEQARGRKSHNERVRLQAELDAAKKEKSNG